MPLVVVEEVCADRTTPVVLSAHTFYGDQYTCHHSLGEVNVLQFCNSPADRALDGKSVMMVTTDASTQLCLVEGVQYINDGVINVIVANPGPESVTLLTQKSY